MLPPRMLLNLSTMPCTFLSSAFFHLPLCTEIEGKSRVFPPEVSEQEQEVLALNKYPPIIPLAVILGFDHWAHDRNSGVPQELGPGCRLVPVGASSPGGCRAPEAEESCAPLLCWPLSDHAVLAVCKAVYYRHVNNLSQRLITWKGNQSCGSSLKSMPISLALGRELCFFVFHSRNKYVTTDPAPKGNTYL